MTIHVVPVGGEEPVHVCSDGCWCMPLREPVSAGGGATDYIVVHNANDLREKYERQGLMIAGSYWVLVRQGDPSGD